MHMKNLTTLLAIIFMASTTLLASYIEDEKETIPIPIKVGDLENSHIFRTPIVIPFECWYYGISNSIVVNCLTTILDLEVYIQNIDTGEYYVERFDMVQGTFTIPINDALGTYQIRLKVNNCQIFIGDLSLN